MAITFKVHKEGSDQVEATSKIVKKSTSQIVSLDEMDFFDHEHLHIFFDKDAKKSFFSIHSV